MWFFWEEKRHRHRLWSLRITPRCCGDEGLPPHLSPGWPLPLWSWAGRTRPEPGQSQKCHGLFWLFLGREKGGHILVMKNMLVIFRVCCCWLGSQSPKVGCSTYFFFYSVVMSKTKLGQYQGEVPGKSDVWLGFRHPR